MQVYTDGKGILKKEFILFFSQNTIYLLNDTRVYIYIYICVCVCVGGCVLWHRCVCVHAGVSKLREIDIISISHDIYTYTPGQKYITTLKNEKKKDIYNF